LIFVNRDSLQERGVDMALIRLNSPSPAFDPARAAKTFHDNILPHEALTRLNQLHREAGCNLRQAQLLAGSPAACIVLMSIGALALLWAGLAGGGTLKADFAWAMLVLLGVIAMTRNFIRGYACSLQRVSLEEAAATLHPLLLYTGAAWGAGAFLVLPDRPAPILVFLFAAAPSLALTRVMRDPKASLAFVGPATLITAVAALLETWPLDVWVATAILGTGTSFVAFPMLRRVMRRDPLPGPAQR
jgi:hypothetical protein